MIRAWLRRWGAIAAAGSAIAAITIAVYVANAASLVGHLRGEPYVVLYSADTADPLEVMLALGDGQAFAAIARDPTLARPEAYRGAGEAAFRANRPLLGYVAWAASLGRPDWVPEAMLALSIAAAAALAVAGGMIFEQRGETKWGGILMVLLPGSIASLAWFGPEMLGMALVLFGLLAHSKDRRGLALALFALAGLTRETYLVVPVLLALRHRRYLLAPVVWLAWTGVVWIRFGHWGLTASLEETSLLVPPFVGVVDAFDGLQSPELTVALMIVTLALPVLVVWLRPRDPLTPAVAAYGAFAVCMNFVVWSLWSSFTRPLLPLYAFAVVALVAGRRDGSRARVRLEG